MDNSEKKVLVDVDIKATQALKELAELRIKADELKKAQKELDRTTDEGRQQYEALGQQIKALNTVANERQKTIQSEIKTQNEQKGSLQQLKAELSLMTAQYNKLSEADRNTARGQALSKSIADTTNKLSEAEKALGNFHRQVGNYEVATKGLRTQVRELTEQLATMKLAGKDSTEEYRAMADQLGQLKDAMADVSEETGNIANDTRRLSTAGEALNILSSSFASYQAILGLTTGETKEYAEIMKKLQVATIALGVAMQMQNSLQKQSNIYMFAAWVLEKARYKEGLKLLANRIANNASMATSIAMTKLWTAAQWLLNKAMMANPVILLITGVVALGVAIYALTRIFDKSAKAQKNAEKASQAYEKQAERTAVAIDNLNNKEKNATNERENRLRREI